ncbi:hypothetical protein P3447_08270 [Vibrio parahaemolyticus]|nr:hypothetical protein [Vibrio parahaemolyticus]
MSIPFHTFINELKRKYESSKFLLSHKANVQLSFVESAIRDTTRTIPLRMAGAESISEAVMLAGKLGVDLDPTLGHGRLTALQSNSSNKFTCVLDLSLAGMMDAFSRVSGMKVHSLQSAYDSHQLTWQGDVMNASVSVSVKSNAKTVKTLIGAFCVIELASGDRLPTAISKAEIRQLAELSNLSPDALLDDFALKHVFKRALKTLVTPSNSQLSTLQQATKLIDINLFEQSKLTKGRIYEPLHYTENDSTQLQTA